MILSGGQQQRLVIARAIAIEPEVLLLDEPARQFLPEFRPSGFRSYLQHVLAGWFWRWSSRPRSSA